MKAMPLIFCMKDPGAADLRPGLSADGRLAVPEDSRVRPRTGRGPRNSLAQAAGSVIVSLSPMGSKAGAILELSHTGVVGRTVTRTTPIHLGGGRPSEAPDGGALVRWWNDRWGRLHARLSLADGPPSGGPGSAELKYFDSANDAACFMFETFWPVLELERKRARLDAIVSRRLGRAERAMEKVRAEIEDAKRAEEYRHKGQLLLTRQSSVARGSAEVTITDYDGQTPVVIRLDPCVGVQQNAEVFFRRARKAERRGVRAPRRLKQLEAEAEKLREVASEIPGAGHDRLDEMETEIPGRSREAQRRPETSRPRFRTYVVSGGWEVLVGKSGRDNDALTHKLAKPDDLWFHARQVAGSHVVLRRSGSKAEPDRRAILEAAAIAAYHSKAGKSSKVSVCYTEKRHVRRARGGRPGQAVVSREKVVMVRPSLPES
jgi:hypothetical protein